MTCSVNCFGPEPDRSLILSKHCSGHFNKCSILSLDHTILLRCISSREFMCKAIFIKKFLDMSVFEFCTIVTSDMLERQFIFSLSSLCEGFENFNNLALVI